MTNNYNFTERIYAKLRGMKYFLNVLLESLIDLEIYDNIEELEVIDQINDLQNQVQDWIKEMVEYGPELEDLTQDQLVLLSVEDFPQNFESISCLSYEQLSSWYYSFSKLLGHARNVQEGLKNPILWGFSLENERRIRSLVDLANQLKQLVKPSGKN